MTIHSKMNRSFAALCLAPILETREADDDMAVITKALADIQLHTAEAKKAGEGVKALDTKMTDLQTRLYDLETKAARPSGGFFAQKHDGLNRDEFHTEIKKLATFFETGDGLDRKGITSTGGGAAGGFALPEVIDTMIMDQLRNFSPIRQIARVVSVTSSDYKTLVGVGGVGTAWNGESTDRSAETASPLMAEVAPTHGELWAKPEISQWALDDLLIQPESWLQVNVTDTFAQTEGAAFVSGDGTNKPTGFLAGPAPVATGDAGRAFGTLQYVASGAAGAFVAASASVSPADALINVIYTLKAGYRVNGRWVMNSQTAGAVRKFKDLEGRFLWSDPLAEGQPPLLLGYPVIIAEDMPDIAANAFPIAFGDFSRGYIIADRVGIRIIRDEVTKPGFVRYLIGRRVGGKLLDTSAIKLLKMAIS